ncbi:tRNA (N(6)-L-threonylcarbamoyladenosine(37)-C(2))-methylthiotransferase MtaB [Ruminiclostridium cellulolyticum]|uniref:Threonylcarbamoyladenosine tRNA methylthiotransferase MtaB n=1 Tax=Ruminiclostridium cellulolyticum (strain ATCC 35319 / DSM 5812 / JCM 6584 / H10) TaxID=394503 RepID=B8I4S9_RUMCH|nr:tRNA (N(6)-L-threonylcarbamoyladenosine(37)-C(2))-methylthiotransferase MtaB [Ruminiclostridium cellulolyticum]ACL76583.1 RNA modification enzyme, MiaB family [Ruminiclostridium cellulolyticum H10]
MEDNYNEIIDENLNNDGIYRKKKTVSFHTLGCKVNQYESEAVSSIFEKNGYEVVSFEQDSDVYIINTCTVTNLSDRKSRQAIRKAKKTNPNSIVIVMGCYAQTSSEEVLKIPGVDMVIGTKDRSRIIEYVERIESGECRINAVDNIMVSGTFEELKLSTYKERTRAYLKIQEGCSQFCSYCIIPYARGPIRSRKPDDIIEEVKHLAESGFLEIVLTGIHLASFGREIKDTNLLDIIKKTHSIDGIKRIRLGSLEPTTITEEFVDAVGRLPKLCPHFHLSLQSGCDKTLAEMNRKYRTDEYRKSVELLKNNIPDVAITTDLMVGFPGETEEDFLMSRDFAEEIGFSKIHVFKYSPRKGTPAAVMKNQIGPEEKERRSEIMLDLSDELEKKYMEGFVGRNMEVLYEQEMQGKEGYIEGLTKNYIRVMAKGDSNLKGKLMETKLYKVNGTLFEGNII